MQYSIFAIALGAAGTCVVATLAASVIAKLGFPLPPTGKRLGAVDGLRGYLALSVLIHHFIIWVQVARLGQAWDDPSLNTLNELGAGAVALFFMTTGLVFYPRIRAGFRACSWPTIFIGRVFRILPLIVASVAVITMIIAARTGHRLDRAYPVNALRWILAEGETPLLGYADSARLNAYVLWSLHYEWLFYLLALPASALAMDVIRGRLPSIVVPLSLWIIATAANAVGATGSLMLYLHLFAIGMLAHECQSSARLAALLRTRLATVLAVAALVTGMSCFKTPFHGAAPALFGFFFICVACGNDLGGLLRTRGALVLGECSYGIYILHGTVLNVLFVDATGVTGLFSATTIFILLPAVAAGVAGLTSLTYLGIELPSIRLGKRVDRLWTGRGLRVPLPLDLPQLAAPAVSAARES